MVVCTEASLGDDDTGAQGAEVPSQVFSPASSDELQVLPRSNSIYKGGIRLKPGDWFGEIGPS